MTLLSDFIKQLFEKNIQEQALAIQHLEKLINLFYKNYLDKLIATSSIINITLLIARSTIKFTKSINKNNYSKLTIQINKVNRVKLGLICIVFLAFFQNTGNLHIQHFSLNIM